MKVFWTLAIGLAALNAGCAPPTCTVDGRFPDDPISAIECPSEQVCYRGECVGRCTAGRERVTACTSDEGCEGSRPRCVDGFCSACPVETRCIAVLDICAEVAQVPRPPEPDRPEPGRPLPPEPTVEGTLSPGAQREEPVDADPVRRPVTHTLFLELAETTVLAGPGRSGSLAAIRAYDVRGNPAGVAWRLDRGAPRVEENLRDARGCDLNRLLVPTSTPTAVDFGEVVLNDADDSGALRDLGSFRGLWNAAERRYELVPFPLPEPLLRFSDRSEARNTFLQLSGRGRSGLTSGAWPNGASPALHVPFLLRLEDSTRTLLSQVVALGPSPDRDLVLPWVRIGDGVIATEQVVVRIPGRRHEIICRQAEGPGTPGVITVQAGLLEALRIFEEAEPGAAYPLFIERVGSVQLRVDPDPNSENRHFVAAQVRHGFQGLITF